MILAIVTFFKYLVAIDIWCPNKTYGRISGAAVIAH